MLLYEMVSFVRNGHCTKWSLYEMTWHLWNYWCLMAPYFTYLGWAYWMIPHVPLCYVGVPLMPNGPSVTCLGWWFTFYLSVTSLGCILELLTNAQWPLCYLFGMGLLADAPCPPLRRLFCSSKCSNIFLFLFSVQKQRNYTLQCK